MLSASLLFIMLSFSDHHEFMPVPWPCFGEKVTRRAEAACLTTEVTSVGGRVAPMSFPFMLA